MRDAWADLLCFVVSETGWSIEALRRTELSAFLVMVDYLYRKGKDMEKKMKAKKGGLPGKKVGENAGNK